MAPGDVLHEWMGRALQYAPRKRHVIRLGIDHGCFVGIVCLLVEPALHRCRYPAHTAGDRERRYPRGRRPDGSAGGAGEPYSRQRARGLAAARTSTCRYPDGWIAIQAADPTVGAGISGGGRARHRARWLRGPSAPPRKSKHYARGSWPRTLTCIPAAPLPRTSGARLHRPPPRPRRQPHRRCRMRIRQMAPVR